jgi:hypothetical protein
MILLDIYNIIFILFIIILINEYVINIYKYIKYICPNFIPSIVVE